MNLGQPILELISLSDIPKTAKLYKSEMLGGGGDHNGYVQEIREIILISGSNPPPSPSPTIADVTTSRSCWICPIHKQKYPLFWIQSPLPSLKTCQFLDF